MAVNNVTFNSMWSFTRSSTATYISNNGTLRSAAIDVPRFQYVKDGSEWVSQGVFVEYPSTNSILQSEDFDNASWNKSGITVTANSTVAPDGLTTADTITSSGSLAIDQIDQNVSSFVAGNYYSIGPFFKKGTSTFIRLLYIEDGATDDFVDIDWSGTSPVVSGGSTLDQEVETLTDGWYRISIGRNSSGTSTFAKLAVQPDRNAIGGSVIMWGGQGANNYSSYIPTTTAAVTKNADNLSRTVGIEYNADTFSGFAIFNGKMSLSKSATSANPLSLSTAASSGGVPRVSNKIDNAGDYFLEIVDDAGVVWQSATYTAQVTAGRNIVGFSIDTTTGRSIVVVNGVTIGISENNTGTFNNITNHWISDSSNNVSIKTGKFLLYGHILSESELQTTTV